MHDIKWIRQNPEAFDAGLKRRGLDARSPEILKLDEKKRGAQTELQELQKKRNEVAAKIGQAKAKGEDAAPIMAEAGKLKETIAAMEAGLTYGELEAVLEAIPNLPAEDVPQGTDETGNKLVREWGKKPELVFKPKEHFDLGEKLGLMSFDDAAKISGARFVVLKGALAKMERALAALFLDMNTAVGYTEVSPPFLANSNTMYGTGQLPKFGEDLFEILTEFKKLEHKYELQKASFNVRSEFQDRASIILEKFSQAMAHAKELGSNVAWSGPIFGLLSEFFNKNKIDFGADVENFRASAKKFEELSKQGIGRFFLIPTAEVPLTNLVGDSILEEEKLPMRMTAYTPCFRSEAGSAGKDTRGMIRQHQFSKVEMVSITTPEQSKAEHERMTGQAEAILQKLGLAYRVMLLCTGDMGFSSEKTYDIEVWLPGQNMYREISSCSNCGAFQARRMKARYKAKGAKETQFVHTLNGSGLPIGRTMVAILENYQNADGSITVPEALRPYMGMDVIK